MLKQFLYGAAALAIVGGVAYAENNAATPPAAPAVNPQVTDNAGSAVQPQPDDGQGWWSRMRGHHGHRRGHMGMMDEGGPGGPGMMGGPGGPGMMAMMGGMQGFHLTLGNGIDVHVMCGKVELKDCIANAQPLIDAAKSAAAVQPQTKAQ